MNKHSFESLLNKEGFFASIFPIEEVEQVKEHEFTYEDIYEVSDTFKFEFENAGIMRGDTIATAKVTPIYEEPTLLKDILEEEVDEKYFLGENLEKWQYLKGAKKIERVSKTGHSYTFSEGPKWQYLKGAKKIERVSKTGHSYTFSEGPIAFPDPLDRPARTILTSESSVNRSTHVVEDLKTKQLRLLTPVEAERIQGFNSGWTDTGMPEKFRYFCMGNALVVGLVERMGVKLKDIFEKES